jgi:hypothetical protein
MREGVDVVEVLRRLDQRHLRILEVPEQPIDDVRQRHVVGIELQDEFARRDAQRVVQISRFRIRIADAADVADAQPLGHRFHILALPVIEHVGAVRIPDRPRADRRAA